MRALSASQGFTVLELMITVTIIAILSTFALGSTQTLTLSGESKTVTQKVYHVLQYARAEAIKRGQIVTICPVDTDGECSSDWGTEIRVFSDPDNNRSIDQPEDLLHSFEPPQLGYLRITVSNHRYFQFKGNGVANGTPGRVTYCPPNGDASIAGQVVLSMAGRTRLARDTNGDGIPENPDGSPINCT